LPMSAGLDLFAICRGCLTPPSSSTPCSVRCGRLASTAFTRYHQSAAAVAAKVIIIINHGERTVR
jgi:hypothetical protein